MKRPSLSNPFGWGLRTAATGPNSDPERIGHPLLWIAIFAAVIAGLCFNATSLYVIILVCGILAVTVLIFAIPTLGRGIGWVTVGYFLFSTTFGRLAPFPTIPMAGYLFAGALTLAASINVIRSAKGTFVVNGEPAIVALIFVLYAMVTGIWSSESPDGWELLRQFCVLFTGPVLILVFSGPNAHRGLMTTYLIFTAVFGLFLFLFFRLGHGNSYRVIDFGQNYMSGALGPGIILGFWTFFRPDPSRLKLTKILGGAAFGLGLYGVLLLASRGIFLALIPTLLIVWSQTIRSVRQAFVTGLLVALGVAGMFAMGLFDSVIRRFSSGDVSNLNSRLPIWHALMDHAAKGNAGQIIFGFGHRAQEPIVRSVISELTSTHNAYIAIFFGYGIVGLILVAVTFGFALRGSNPRQRSKGVLAIALTIYLVIQGAAAEMIDTYPFWFVLAFIAAVVQSSDEDEIPVGHKPTLEPVAPTDPLQVSGT